MSQKPSIYPLPNGPYVFKDPKSVTPATCLTDDAGTVIANQPYLALCRCGGSNTKPFCDGTHLKNGFRSEKSPDRTPDQRDNYVGKKVTIHDNRGTCAHAGHCTEGLPKVFREDEDPWIDPNGAAPKAIIETIRHCPSGALSHSVDGVEHRDQDRPPRVLVTPDGPYEVQGGVELLETQLGEGASREHYSLCRCGGSKNKPFCDGTHFENGFQG
jgi:CDGSH-type Zn-finger protein